MVSQYIESTSLRSSSDGAETFRLTAPGPGGGLWDLAGFTGENIYRHGGPLAPFDRRFYFILSAQSGEWLLASLSDLGGAGGWPFSERCDPAAPWADQADTRRRQFWEARTEWLDSWDQPFSIDYVRVYQ